jgi:glutathione S-transferase
MIQGGKRFVGGSRPPEDAKLGLAKGRAQSYGTDTEISPKAKMQDIRWQRIVLNDLENIPLALIVSIVSIIARGNETINSILFVTFTLSRIGHTITYAKELQPHRAFCWFGAVLSVIGITLNGSVAAIFY